jgi:hypothetical protein
VKAESRAAGAEERGAEQGWRALQRRLGGLVHAASNVPAACSAFRDMPL